MRRMVRALLVYSSDTLPSSRIRIVQITPHLKARGVDAELRRYPHTVRNKLELRRSFADYDLVVLQKKIPSRGDGSLLWNGCRVPLVFDYDDAIMYLDEPDAEGSYESARRRARFDRMMDRADALICGNDFLAGHAPDKPKLIAPSPVPHDVPQRRAREANDLLRVGWVGGQKNLPSVEIIADALRAASANHPFELVVVSDGTLSMEGVNVRNVAWSLEQQEREIAGFDVGVMPLSPSPWSQGKCAYKALQYMAAGVPVIASEVGMNRTLITDAVNGRLASGPEAWEIALSELLGDPGARDRLGDAGRRTVEEGYTYEVQAGRWARFFEEDVLHDSQTI